jgi:putative DNA-invertase from lambdoid prophage Rac
MEQWPFSRTFRQAATYFSTLNNKQKQDVCDDLATRISVSAIAKKFATSRQTIMRVHDKSSPSVPS